MMRKALGPYVKGLSHRWTFLQRTIPDIEELMLPLEEAISETLIPALVGRSVSPIERDILALPIRMGGMGLYNPAKSSKREYQCSKNITSPLVELILCNQDMSVKYGQKIEKEKEYMVQLGEINSKLNSKTKRAME